MLENERIEIDRLDREIVKLFEERTKLVEKVAEVKLANNKVILELIAWDVSTRICCMRPIR